MPKQFVPEATKLGSVIAAIEAMRFAASTLDGIDLGKGSQAGIKQEAAQRLKAQADHLSAAFPEIAQNARMDELRALALAYSPFDAATTKASPFSAYAEAAITTEAETEGDALAALERIPGLVAACNTERYKASFIPEPRAEELAQKNGPAFETTSHWFAIKGILGGPEVVTLHAYGRLGDAFVEWRIVITKPAMRRAYRVVEVRGGIRIEDQRLVNYAPFARHYRRLWSTAEHPGDMVAYT